MIVKRFFNTFVKTNARTAFMLICALQIIFLMGCEDRREPVSGTQDENMENAVTRQSAPDRTQEPSTTLQPDGSSGAVNGLQFALNGVSIATANGEQWDITDDQQVLSVDITVTNERSAAFVLSALVVFRIEDSEGNTWGISLADMQTSSLDATLEPGQSVRGTAAFVLPKDTQELSLWIKPEVISTDVLVFSLDMIEAVDATSNVEGTRAPTATSDVDMGDAANSASQDIKLSIGETGECDDWAFTVLGAETDREGSGFFLSPDGHVLYLVEVNVQNLAEHERDIVSLLDFRLIDANEVLFDPVVNPGVSQSMDGEIQPGGSLQGKLTFVVPEESLAEGCTLQIAPGFIMGGALLIDLGYHF